jgi:hypothetical protein
MMNRLVIVSILSPAAIRHFGLLMDLGTVATNVEGALLSLRTLQVRAQVLSCTAVQLAEALRVVRYIELELPGPTLGVVRAPRELVEGLYEFFIGQKARSEEIGCVVEDGSIV